MKLTAENHPESIKRYAHVKPARVGRSGRCGVRCPGTARTCTLEAGHRGPHVGHDAARRVAAVWDESVMRAAGEPHTPVTPVPSSRKAWGMERQDGSGGVLATLWSRVRLVVPSFETFLFLVFLVAFLKFTFDWLILIL